jgi:hypothetical protein
MPQRVQSRHTITLPLPVDRAFMLFTPAGEEHWVPGWQPRYLDPSDGTTRAGMVFTTGEGDDYTVWHLADFDREATRSRYVRATPASRSGFVQVQCRALSPERTEVTVDYDLTALTPGAEATLEAYAGKAFEGMIEDWARRIEACLPTLRTVPLR